MDVGLLFVLMLQHTYYQGTRTNMEVRSYVELSLLEHLVLLDLL